MLSSVLQLSTVVPQIKAETQTTPPTAQYTTVQLCMYVILVIGWSQETRMMPQGNVKRMASGVDHLLTAHVSNAKSS